MSRLAQVYSSAQMDLMGVIEDLREAHPVPPPSDVQHIIENLDGEINMLQELIDKEGKK
jgi:hypothetical protein